MTEPFLIFFWNLMIPIRLRLTKCITKMTKRVWTHSLASDYIQLLRSEKLMHNMYSCFYRRLKTSICVTVWYCWMHCCGWLVYHALVSRLELSKVPTLLYLRSSHCPFSIRNAYERICLWNFLLVYFQSQKQEKIFLKISSLMFWRPSWLNNQIKPKWQNWQCCMADGSKGQCRK